MIIISSLCHVGFMYGSTVLDKDGISSLVAAAEYATSLYKCGSNFAEELQKIYQKYVIVNIDHSSLIVVRACETRTHTHTYTTHMLTCEHTCTVAHTYIHNFVGCV